MKTLLIVLVLMTLSACTTNRMTPEKAAEAQRLARERN